MSIDKAHTIHNTQRPSEDIQRKDTHEAVVMQQGKALLQKQALEALLGKQLTRNTPLDLTRAIPHD